MGWLEGILTGYGDRRREIADENYRHWQVQTEKENALYQQLLNSKDPKIAALAGTGLLNSMQPKASKNWMRNWMGEMEANPAYPALLKYMQTPQATTEVTGHDLPSIQRFPTERGLTTAPGIQPQPPASAGTYLPEAYAGPQAQQQMPEGPAPLPGTSPTQGGPMATQVPLPADFPPDTTKGGPFLPPPKPDFSTLQLSPEAAKFGNTTFRAGVQERQPPPVFREQAAYGADQTRTTMQLPGNPFPTTSDTQIAARRAQIQGDFQALTDMYVATGLPVDQARKKAAEAAVAMHSRAIGANQFQSLELEWTDATGKIQKGLGSYNKAIGRYVDANGQPIQGNVTKAQPASALGMGIWVNQAMRELHVSELDMRNDPGIASTVVDYAAQLAADAGAAGVTGRGIAASQVPLSTPTQVSATLSLRDDWRIVSTKVRDGQTAVAQMKTAFNNALADEKFIPPAAESMIVLFERALDPDSVVREAEAARPGQFSPLLARLQAIVDNYRKGGAKVTLEDLRSYVSLADQMTQAAAIRLEDERARIESLATRWGLDPRSIVPRTMLATPPPPPPAATAPTAPPTAATPQPGAPPTAPPTAATAPPTTPTPDLAPPAAQPPATWDWNRSPTWMAPNGDIWLRGQPPGGR